MGTPSQRDAFDVVVVGGGVIGLSCAWRAAQRGLSVALVERGELGAGTSRVAAGMLAPVAEAEVHARAALELALASAARYPGWSAELAQASGCPTGYRTRGTLLVARDRDEAEALEREAAIRDRLGLAPRRLRPSDARRLEQALAPTIRAALELPDDHAVDPRALLPALAAAARGAGVAVHEQAGEAILRHADGRVRGVTLAAGRELDAERVVLAAGPWSGLLRELPSAARVPVRPVKGQILLLRDPAGPGLLERAVRLERSYIVPRGDGRYVLGATVEERGWDAAATVGGVHELLRDAAEVVPGLNELELLAIDVGFRPGTPDNAPLLGPGALDGLIWATGHYRNGVLLAPITGDLIGELLVEGCLPALAQPFAPQRFAGEHAAGGQRAGAAAVGKIRVSAR